MDAFQWAFVAAVAERDGRLEAKRMADTECGKAIRREMGENRQWQRRLHGKER